MCSMCPNIPGHSYPPEPGDPDCQFIDWTFEETGWITENSNEPSGIIDERGEVEFGPAVEVDDYWSKYSDDAASWPEPGQWAVDSVGELPEWLVRLENFSVVEPEDYFVGVAEAEDMLSSEATLAPVG